MMVRPPQMPTSCTMHTLSRSTTTNIRLDRDVHLGLKESARANERSLTAEARYALKKYLEQQQAQARKTAA